MNYTLESLAEEQKELLLERFDYDFAWRLGVLLRERAVQGGHAVAITVTHGTDLVFLALMPGATPDNIAWTARKRAVAHRFQRSSLAMRIDCEVKGRTFSERFGLSNSDFAASGGALPLILKNGTLVGTVAVSGLPDVDDHRLVVGALRTLLTE